MRGRLSARWQSQIISSSNSERGCGITTLFTSRPFLAMAAAPAEDMLRALGEVARVFKAKDLNLVRANQFLNYAKTGEGENPLAGFWEEAE